MMCGMIQSLLSYNFFTNIFTYFQKYKRSVHCEIIVFYVLEEYENRYV